jgi:3-oxoacyl-[acyl-carrier protein] reductase
MELGLMERIAIVTGGAGSIGSEICRTLASEGVRVVVNDFKAEERGESLVSEINESGGQGVYLEADISQARAVKQLVEKAKESFGGIHFLINCAGVATGNFVWEMSEKEWDWVLDINLKGTFLTCREVLPVLIEQKFGRIVNIASLVARQGSYRHSHYCASKAGVIGFTQSLAKEVGPHGICANCISPGRTKSTMEADRQKKEQAEWISQTPLGRMGLPKDIANAVVYLCSEAASFVTGEILNVNGGIWIG